MTTSRSSLSEPPDVALVRAFAKTEKVAWVHRASHHLSKASLVAISVIRNEVARLPEFLDHHRRLGVQRFAIIDNNSTDGGPAYLAQQPDVDLFRAATPFEWRRKHGWIMQVVERIGRGRWFLLLDADEHAVFVGCEQRPIQDLTEALAAEGRGRARACLVDMYAEGPIREAAPEAGVPLAARFPLFDAATYREHRTTELTARTGGPRQRLLSDIDPSFSPALTKYPLFRLGPGDIAYNPHAIWPPEPTGDDPCLIALMHYKFDEGFLEKIRDALETGAYWDGSREYRMYLKAIEQDPSLSLDFHGSQRFERVDDFLALGLISDIKSPTVDSSLVSRIRRAERERMADLLAGRRPEADSSPEG